MRLNIGASTGEAPNSTTRSSPCATIASAVSCQSTSSVTERTRFCLIVSTSAEGLASTLEMTLNLGGSTVVSATWAANSSAAGCISTECQAPATLSGTTRLAPAASAASPASRTASASPLITIWPGALKLASWTRPAPPATVLATTMRSFCGSRPSTAAIAPWARPAARCMASPRWLTSESADSKLSEPASVSEHSSPNECPAETTGASASPTARASAMLVTKIAGWA